MDPVSLTMTAAGLGAGGSLMQGMSGQQQARFQRQIAQQNQAMSIQRAEVERTRLGREQRRRMGRARTVAATRGVTLEGAPLEFLSDQAAEAAEEQSLIQFGADVQATQFDAQARALRQAGRESLIGGVAGAGGSLLGGLAQARLVAP